MSSIKKRIMHELTLAMNVVEIAEEEVRKSNAKIVNEIGTLSGVIPEAMEFAMTEAVKNTVLHNSKITYRIIPAKAKCMKCSTEFVVEDFYNSCPKCSSFENEILQGRELKVRSLVVN